MSDITIPVLPADLPEDFKMQDIIAPNGADVGKSPQHGYNYLMQQMNETQRAVMKMAEDANSAFENKVTIGELSGVDLNVITADGHYRLNGGCTNAPITGGGWEQWTQLIIVSGKNSDNCTQIMPIYSTNEIYTRTIRAVNPTVWTPWSRLATAEPPQKYDLTFAPGFSTYTPSRFWKNQFDECTVIIRCQSSVNIVSGQPMAILPESFYPSSYTSALCKIKYASGDIASGHVDALPNWVEDKGKIVIYPDRLVASNAVDIIIDPILF